MKTYKTILFVVVILATTCISCEKEPGPQGPAGTNGTNGVDGNANVHSQTFTVSSWTYSAPSYYTDIWDTDITQSIVDNGAVIVYLSNDFDGWSALPVTVYPSSSYASTYETVHYLYGVTIWKTDSDLTQPANPGTRTFKVVAIASSEMAAHPNIDWYNYSQVQEYYNLSD